MDQIIEFIKYLKWNSFVEINNLDSVIDFKSAMWKKNIYFTCWLSEKLSKRCNDNDIKTKKYFVVDIDMRLDHFINTWEVLDQTDMLFKMSEIVSKLENNWFGNYCAIVDSWNWMHLYYSWTERNFDKKIYSDWVSYIYTEIDEIISEFGFKCDPVCSNISRITRLPWTINPRCKKKKEQSLWDLWDYECKIIDFKEKESEHFNKIEDYAVEYNKIIEEEKKIKQEIKHIVRENHKKDNLWEEINNISACDVACDVWGVSVVDRWLETVALNEWHKNMWAYWYKPENVIVNTWSSLIKHKEKKTFTSYELVYYELMNKDWKATVEYFRDKYWIKINDKKTNEVKKEIIIPKCKYDKIWYVYPNDVFNDFDCFMSWELVTIIAESNSWKTTFAMDIIKANSDLWKKWFYINLEFAIETMRQSRWLWLNKKKKRNLTDLDPLSAEEKEYMDNYVKKNLKKFDYYNSPKWITLENLVELIITKKEEWYWMFVIDTFSRIEWNLDSMKARTSQNKAMEILQELAQNLWVAIVLLHHTNKVWTFEWSQKIMDLSNVFILIKKASDWDWEEFRKFILSKDKFITNKEIDVRYRDQTYFSF